MKSAWTGVWLVGVALVACCTVLFIDGLWPMFF